MESVIATVSGYHGADRFNLIKLIDRSGASYVGAMSSSITHLVCWKFEGRKYEIAMRSGTIVVNHRWIEDCVKLGRRVSEDPYMLLSGEELGPIVVEVPAKTQRVLSDRTNSRDGGSENRRRHLGFEASGDLFNMSWFSGAKKHDHSQKSKCKLVEGTRKKELRSISKRSLQDPPMHRLRRNRALESSSDSSMDMGRDKRKVYCDNESTRAETSRKGRRRLVKKNKKREMVELLSSDSDEEHFLSRVDCPSDDTVVVLSDHADGKPAHDYATKNQLQESLRTESPNRASSLLNANERTENADTTAELISEDRCYGAESSKVETTEELNIRNDSHTPSTELSCVICWTDFSSSRGVLPCGHRFCYSCIENWADHMASRRKISTCPLCKTSFREILKFDDPATNDQKIYSQTIPCGLSKMNMFVLPDHERRNLNAQSESRHVCSVCCCLEPEDLLISCNLCQIRRIHSYCLDPPINPWTCSDCKELQRLYLFNRYD